MGDETVEKLTKDSQYREYTRAVNPLGQGTIPPVATADFLHTLHEQGPTRVIPFDLSEKLECSWTGTSPALLSNFIRIEPNEEISTRVNATSELYYVIRGSGVSTAGDTEIRWSKGDFVVVPGGRQCKHRATDDAALYWVHDEPLLAYLGTTVSEERFAPTLYPAEVCARELEKVASDPHAHQRNRISVLLGNTAFPQTMTVTHTLWAMLGILPTNSVQLPHRHNSVALDLILDCAPGCYTLIGRGVRDDGTLLDPIRQDWHPYSAFVTPPFMWHSHHNESGQPAHLIPIQDAGLHNYLRTLDIEFSHANQGRRKSDSQQGVVNELV
ncbi:MAG TPA: cupin domain-containing protein [Planktothrix sp.]|jgi:gentisate 1,2-dioxygenase